MTGEDRRASIACGGKACRCTDRLHVRTDHSLRVGRAIGGRKIRPIDDVAAISRKRDIPMRLDRRAAWLGELAGNPGNFDQWSARCRTQSCGHVIEQADNPRNLLRNRIVEALRTIAALQQEAVTLGNASQRLAKREASGDTDDRRSLRQPLLDRRQGVWVGIFRHLRSRSATPSRFRPWQDRHIHGVPLGHSRDQENVEAGKMAEREGFEPSIRFWRILTFQASAFDHSATAPHALDRPGALACRVSLRKQPRTAKCRQ